jgi:rhodanese-related sulfurtransferase
MFAMLMGLKTISPKELNERMQQSALTIIDLNSEQSWLKARVPGAINLGVDYDAGALPQDINAGLVFYCSNPLCRKAPNAAKRAGKLGYTDIRVMSAGITGWTDARLPVDSGH